MLSLDLHPIFCLLVGVSLSILAWLLYGTYSVRHPYSRFDARIRIPYFLYAASLLLWVSSNTFFYSPWVTIVDETSVLYVAVFANTASFLGFVCACSVTQRLTLDVESRRSHYVQWFVLVSMTLWVTSLSTSPQQTIHQISVIDTGQLVIQFGPTAKWFYGAVLILMTLTFHNILLYLRKARPLRQVKSLYVLTGISVFMISTIIFTASLPLLWDNWDLTWIPPALATTELFLVSYALFTSRFFSNRHVIYSLSSFLLASCFIFTPLIALFHLIPSENNALAILSSCLATGLFWRPVLRKTRRFSSHLVFGHSHSPATQVQALGKAFQISTQYALREIAQILKIDIDDLQLISNLQDENLYTSQLYKHGNVLIFREIEDAVLSGKEVGTIQQAIYAKMRVEAISLVLPIFDVNQRLSHLLLVKNKANGQMYFYEEIKALQHVLNVAQGYINADRKIHQAQVLANSIAHEMRNPLAQAHFQFELLDNKIECDAPKQELAEALNRGRNAIDRGRQLIDMILREVNDTALEQVPTNETSIQHAVTQAIEGYAFDSSEIRTRIHVNISQDFTARLNETLFNFVMFNLLRNGIYYFDTHPDSTIEIKTKLGKFENFLIVRDTGPGVPDGLIKHIFDDFFSYNKTGGSGLGLGYCRRVMKSFGGSIQCYSKVGHYTEFHLSFPIEITPVRSTSSKEPLTCALNVLVVDDKRVQRELVQLQLQQLGYHVMLASNGKIAVELVQQRHIDFILMDIQMPVMDGFEATAIIKRSNPELPVFAFSGESGAQELSKIAQTMDGRLSKPTTKQELKQTIEKTLHLPLNHTITSKAS